MQELVKEYGSEFDWESNFEYLNASHIHPLFKGAQYFRSGRDTLIAIALRHMKYCKKILLPALCCESMVVPFLENGYEVLFYKLNPDFSADFKDILSKMQSDTIFLYMNYFGIISLDNQKINYIQTQFKNAILIEDRTQDILAKRINDYFPDYTVCSIRKWIAIPDGGVLWSSNKDIFPKEKDTYFGDVRLRAMINKSEYLKEANAEMKIKFRSELSKANNYIDENKIVADISKKSYEILKCIDFEKINHQRKENVLSLYRNIENIEGARNISPRHAEQSTLYHPIFVNERDEIKNKLAKQGIYCPVIWPLPRQAIGVCEVSEYTSKHMLAIPCDHRYRATDIEYICDILSGILEDE